jgi:hypothetical protein
MKGMFMKKLLLALFSSLSAMPMFGAVIKVSNIADSGPGSLREAIQIANASGGGTIQFQGGVTGTIQLQTSLPALTQNLVVLGPGAGQITVQVQNFTLTNAAGTTVTIQGLSLTGRYVNPGVIANFGDLRLLDCKISGSAFALPRGGIYNVGTAWLSGCVLSGCTGDEGAAVWNVGSMTVESCTLTNNRAFIAAGIFNSGRLTLENSTVAGNQTITGGDGGGIYNDSNGTMVVRNCSITNNGTLRGSGIWNGGSLAVIGSTIARNGAGAADYPATGGAIFNDTTATAMLVNSTISKNNAYDQGGGIMNQGTLWLLNCTVASNFLSVNSLEVPFAGSGVFNSGTVYSKNTIFAGNSGRNDFSSNTTLVGPDFYGPLISQGFNLIQNASGFTITGDLKGNLLGVDPRLGPLQDNGGPTCTQALLPDSPAINAGTKKDAPDTDQRGVSRPQGPKTDIGAYEFEYRGRKPAK